MPKNKKPAGGRPAKNFDPRYGAKKKSAPAGSRSPGHRGYRSEEAEPVKKTRWNADEREARRSEDGRVDTRAPRSATATRSDRPRYDRDDRPARPRSGEDRYDRAPRYGSRRDEGSSSRDGYRSDRTGSDRPRGDRPSYGRDERPARPRFDRDDRPARPRYDRDERPARPRFDRDERPARPRYDRDDRSGGSRFENKERSTSSRSSDFYPDKSEKGGFTPAEDVVLERLEAQAILVGDVVGKTFSDLGLGDNISRQLTQMGASAPFPIQAATIPEVLAGKDVLGRGKTGSGKTIAFGAPLVERLMENNGGKDRKQGRAARALILAPTRELAMQIDRTVQPIARSVGLFTTTIFGGVPQGKQVMSLRRGVDIIIATPGRLEDLVKQGHIDLGKITITVLDEADHMCDLGFLEPVQRILRSTRPGGQRLLFSATLDKGVAAIVNEFLVEPSVHEVAGEDQASSTIDHRVLIVDQRDKTAIIEELADRGGKTLIFTRTRSYAETLADMLDDAGIPATSLHGDLNQNRRTRNLQMLTSGRVNVLVATDVAARGIHVDDIDLVIQADAPDEYKTYMHRSGRTGRAGKEGTVVTLIPKARQRRMSDLLNRAEIDAAMVSARPGDELIRELAHS